MTRRLNGPQTTGRAFRELSEPAYGLVSERDLQVEARDGTRLLADVFRPSAPGERFPALVASCDHAKGMAMTGFTRLPLGSPSRQHVRASSRLVLPVLPAR